MQDFFKTIFETVIFMVWIRSQNQNRNRNLSKVGTGTLKNSYCSAKQCVTILPKFAIEAHGMLWKNLNLFYVHISKRRPFVAICNQEIQQFKGKIWSRVHISGLTGPETGSEQKVPNSERWKELSFLKRWTFISRTTSLSVVRRGWGRRQGWPSPRSSPLFSGEAQNLLSWRTEQE